MKKVIIIGQPLDFNRINASTRRSLAIFKACRKLKKQVKLVSLSSFYQNKENFIDIDIKLKYIFPSIKNYIAKYFFDYYFSIFYIYNFLKKEKKIDFIIVMSSDFIYVLQLFIFSYFFKYKIILDIVEDPEGQLWMYFQMKKQLMRIGHIERIVSKIFEVYFSRFYFWKKSFLNLCITNNLKEKVENISKKKAYLLPIINDEINLDLSKMNIDKKVYYAYCGSNDEIKDAIDLLIHSFLIVVKKYPNACLYIIGNRQKRIKEKLNMLIEENKLEHNIIFTGFVSDKNLFDILSNACALIVPKRRNKLNDYNFPTKIIDYLKVKRPVIIPNFSVYQEYFNNRKNALLYEENNVESLSNQMLFAYENKGICDIIGQNGFKLLKTEFDAQKYLNIITNIINEKS